MSQRGAWGGRGVDGIDEEFGCRAERYLRSCRDVFVGEDEGWIREGKMEIIAATQNLKRSVMGMRRGGAGDGLLSRMEGEYCGGQCENGAWGINGVLSVWRGGIAVRLHAMFVSMTLKLETCRVFIAAEMIARGRGVSRDRFMCSRREMLCTVDILRTRVVCAAENLGFYVVGRLSGVR